MEDLGKTDVVSQDRVTEYYKWVKFSIAGGEPTPKEFIDCAITVLKRMISIPECTKIVLRLGGQGISNPLDSIYKLHKIIAQARKIVKLRS